ncbi:MAG: aspartyl-tRNA(Asn)/glutamyl-tRNA(Gln) amidotransferase subunit [Actinomycetota bacterium]
MRGDTVIGIADAVRRGERTAVDVLDEALDAIAVDNERLNAFVHVDADLARRAAEAVDAAVARGDDPGVLAGVPFGVKDLEDCAGMPTSHGSLLYLEHGPVAEDSVHVARLRAAGAVPVGKTAAPEFGTLSFTKTKAFGITRNPWNTERTPGGSSGGTAAAVAAGIVPFGTASDGGGSTRIPGGFAGLYGFKASFGRIPSPGPDGSLTTSLGAHTTTVADSARHLDVSAGPHDADRMSLPPAGLSYEQIIESLDVAGLRVRWSVDLGFAAVDPEVAAVTESAARELIAAAKLTDVGGEVVLTDPVRTWLSSGPLDLWHSLEPGMWPKVADDVTFYVRGALEQTETHPLPKYAQALQRKQQLVRDCARVFDEVDVLLCPTTAVPAFPAGGPPPSVIGGREMSTPAMATPFTMLANICWNPAASVPAGLSSDGLPIGLQIMAAPHRDDVVMRLARIFEQAQPWPRFAPA